MSPQPFVPRAWHLGLIAGIMDSASACTVFAAGRKATADGSVLVSHSDDGGLGNDARVIYVPPQDHAPGSKRSIFYAGETFPRYVGPAHGPDYMPNIDTGPNVAKAIGYIDQVAHTYGYQDSTYGIINEHGVSVGESTCGAMFGTCGAGSSIACEPGRKVGVALMSIDTLSELAMERTTSSRQAVELMGAFATKYGFYGPPDSFEGSGESLVVADPEEAWAFQILSDPTGTSAIWVAKRLPDTDVTIVANMFTIREVNSSDKDNYIMSPNLFEVARQKGWWKEGAPLDFTRMYSGGEYSHKYYSGRRMWGFFRLAAPSVTLPDEYEDIRYKPIHPWSLKPDKPVTHRDFMRWHRDWYGGTKYDMTKGLQAGPFGTPDRFETNSSKVKGNWERSIALYRTTSVYVQHLQRPSADRPPGLASVAWFGAGAAHYAPFLPVPAGLSRTLHPLQFAAPKKFEMESMNWATRRVMDTCQIHWRVMHPMVGAAQEEVEDEGDRLVAEMRRSWNEVSQESLNEAFNRHAEKALKTWQDLALNMVFRYSDNADVMRSSALGYPDEWLQSSGYADGPPEPPVQDQCPPRCSAPEGGASRAGRVAPDVMV